MIDHFRETLRKVQHNPGGWLVGPTLASHIAFALGMDEGAGGNLLVGFREYLIARIGTNTTLWWPALVLWLTEPTGPKGRGVGDLPGDLNDRAIATWYRHLDECLSIRANPDGLAQVYADFLGVQPRDSSA
jgi:hypothetical protein